MPKNATQAYPLVPSMAMIGRPLLHHYAIGSFDGVATCTIKGYPVNVDGTAAMPDGGGWPDSSYDVVAMMAIHNWMLNELGVDEAALITNGPWPTGFKITEVQGAALRVRLGTAQTDIGSGNIAFTTLVNVDNTTDWILPVGDYSNAPQFMGIGGPV